MRPTAIWTTWWGPGPPTARSPLAHTAARSEVPDPIRWRGHAVHSDTLLRFSQHHVRVRAGCAAVSARRDDGSSGWLGREDISDPSKGPAMSSPSAAPIQPHIEHRQPGLPGSPSPAGWFEVVAPPGPWRTSAARAAAQPGRRGPPRRSSTWSRPVARRRSRLGEELSVIWELEVGHTVVPDQGPRSPSRQRHSTTPTPSAPLSMRSVGAQ